MRVGPGILENPLENPGNPRKSPRKSWESLKIPLGILGILKNPLENPGNPQKSRESLEIPLGILENPFGDPNNPKKSLWGSQESSKIPLGISGILGNPGIPPGDPRDPPAQ